MDMQKVYKKTYTGKMSARKYVLCQYYLREGHVELLESIANGMDAPKYRVLESILEAHFGLAYRDNPCPCGGADACPKCGGSGYFPPTVQSKSHASEG